MVTYPAQPGTTVRKCNSNAHRGQISSGKPFIAYIVSHRKAGRVLMRDPASEWAGEKISCGNRDLTIPELVTVLKRPAFTSGHLSPASPRNLRYLRFRYLSYLSFLSQLRPYRDRFRIFFGKKLFQKKIWTLELMPSPLTARKWQEIIQHMVDWHDKLDLKKYTYS